MANTDELIKERNELRRSLLRLGETIKRKAQDLATYGRHLSRSQDPSVEDICDAFGQLVDVGYPTHTEMKEMIAKYRAKGSRIEEIDRILDRL